MQISNDKLFGSEALATVLIDRGLINAADAERARGAQSTLGGSLASMLVRSGAISEQTLLPVLSELTGIGQLSRADEPTHGSMIDAACERLKVPLQRNSAN
jgi:general secretion pathway protein E